MTPLPVDRARDRRHAVAAAILAAFASDAGLAELARRTGVPADPSARRLRAGLTAARAHRAAAPEHATPVATALGEAAYLLRAGLFFEVHERLEDVWRGLAGRRREALRGVIQLAVALHHFAHGNTRGAEAQLAKARRRLERDGDALAELDVAAVLAALAPWERALRAGRWPARLSAPALVVRAGERRSRVSSARARRPSR